MVKYTVVSDEAAEKGRKPGNYESWDLFLFSEK